MTSLSTCGLPTYRLFTENVIYIVKSVIKGLSPYWFSMIIRKGRRFPTAVVTTLSKWTSRKNPVLFWKVFLHNWKDTRLV